MPVFRSFDELAQGFASASKELGPQELQRILRRIGKEAQEIQREEAEKDLGGDNSFSGWNRGKPIALTTQVRDLQAGVVGVIPTKRTAGPWTVLNDGRNQGETGLFMGPGINRNTGETARTKKGAVRKTRAFKAKRWNGTTQGKGSADRAVVKIERMVPDRVEDEVRKAFKKHFD